MEVLKAFWLNRKRLKVEEVLLVVIFILISVGAVYFGRYTVKQMEYTRRSRTYYSDNAVGFRIYMTDRERASFTVNGTVAEVLSRHPDCAVHAYTTMPGKTRIVVLAYSGRYPIDVMTQSGTFMTPEQSVGGTPVCVMGADEYVKEKSMQMFYRVENGVEYFRDLFPPNTLYEVVGTCGPEGSDSPLSSVCFLNMGSYELDCFKMINYIMDGADAESVAALRDDLDATFTAMGFDFRTTSLPSEEYTVADFFAMDRLNLIMRVFAVFCVVMSTVPLTLYWSMRRKKATAVRRLLGRSVSSQAFRMLGRLLLLFHIGFVLGCAGWAIFVGAELFSGELLIAYAAGLMINMGIAAVPLVQTMRVEPGDALRRE